MDDSPRTPPLIVFGHDNCGLSRWLAQELEHEQIAHEWRDVLKGDPRFKEELKELAHGYLSVPTVVFPDGTVMIEPRPDEVMSRLRGPNQRRPSWLERLFKAT
jgi:mycoredoxin